MFNYLTTLLFFCSKSCCTGVFVSFFSAFLLKNRKKYANFLQFFIVVYQQVRRKLKKKLVKTLDNFRNCCNFAACLELNKTNQITITTTKNEKKMKETMLHYTRGENTYTVCVFPKVFANLVRRKIKLEHLEEYEAILSVIQSIVASLTCVDSFSFEYKDKEGYKHIISGEL